MSRPSNAWVWASPHQVTHVSPGAAVPVGGSVFSIILSLASVSALVFCFTRRLPRGRLIEVPFLRWLLLITYAISFFFIFLSTIFSHSMGYNHDMMYCGIGIFICLCAYLVSKVLIYLFLVERVRLVHGTRTPRFQDKLFLFNAGVMLIPFIVVAVLNFVYRISFIDYKGECHIGMQRRALIPLLLADAAANVYLTVLFILPLTKLQKFVNGQKGTARSAAKLKSLAIRAVVGCLLTVASTGANAISLIVIEGQPAWLCMVLCNLDVLFCVLVLHILTTDDSADQSGSTGNSGRKSATYVMDNRSNSQGTFKPGQSGSHMSQSITVTRSVTVDERKSDDGDTIDIEDKPIQY